MASSIHIQKSVEGTPGHNARVHYSYSVVFTDEKNECDTSAKDAYSLYREELQKRTEEYTNRTGQKLQKSTVTSLSAVINLEQDHTLKDLLPIKEKLEEKFGTLVYQMAIHRDEGKLISKEDGTELYSGKDFFLNRKDDKLYFDKKFTQKIDMSNYEIVKNYHAHIEMMGLDSEGRAIRQKMSKGALREMQDFVAKSLGMERGQKTKSYTQEQMKEILAKVGSKKDYKSTTLFAQKFNEVARELGYFVEKRKRKDTHQFKDTGAERERAKRAKLKDLKELNKQFRKELQEAGAKRKDYAILEAENKDLKIKIKAKDLTIEELQSKYKTLEQKLFQKEDVNAKLEAKLEELHQELAKPSPADIQLGSELEELQRIVVPLREKMKELGIEMPENKGNSEEEQEEQTLEEQVKKLRKEIKMLTKAIDTEMYARESLEKMQKENAELQTQNNSLKETVDVLQTQNAAKDEQILALEQKTPNLDDFDTQEIKKELDDAVNQHFQLEDLHQEVEENGFFKKKAYEPVEKITVEKPDTFFQKIRQMAIRGTAYAREKFDDLKQKYDDLKQNYENLLDENFNLQYENGVLRKQLKEKKSPEKYNNELNTIPDLNEDKEQNNHSHEHRYR